MNVKKPLKLLFPLHKTIAKGIIALSALFVTLLFLLLYFETGPAWIMSPNDHGYYILFNVLNLLQGEPLGRIFYPASTNLAFGALVVIVSNLFSSGDMIEAVLANPEYYHRLYVLSQFAVLFIVLLAGGLSIFHVTRRLTLGIFFIAAPLLLPASTAGLVIAGGMPELFQFIGGFAVASIGALAMRNETNESTQKWLAIGLGAAVSFTIFTKFTAGALLLFPFLVLSGWRARGIFIVSCIIFSILFALPVWDSVMKLYGMFAAKLPEFFAEGTQRSGETSLFNIITTNYQRLSRSTSVFTMARWFITGGAAFGVLFWRKAPETRILIASALTVWAGVLFILVRPRTHYLYGYSGVLALGLVSTVFLLGRLSEEGWYQKVYRHTVLAVIWFLVTTVYLLKRLSEKGWYQKVYRQTVLVIVLLVLAFIGKTFTPSYERQYTYWRSIVDGATSLNALLDEKYSNLAQIHTPHTDSKAWAYYMSSFNSDHRYQKELAKRIPKNIFFYRWDGRTFYDFLNRTYSMEDILGQYPGAAIYGSPFLNTRSSITGYENKYVEPEGVSVQIERHSIYKRVAKIIKVPVSGVGRAVTREGDTIWRSTGRQVLFSWKQQAGQPAYFDFTATPWLRSFQISGYSFAPFNDEDVGNMPKSWRLLGSNDGNDWTQIDEQRDVKNWFPIKRRYYAIPIVSGSPDPFLKSPPEGTGVLSAGTYVDLVKKLKSSPPEYRGVRQNVNFVKAGNGFNVFKAYGTYYAVPFLAGKVTNWTPKNLDNISGIVRGSSTSEVWLKGEAAQFTYPNKELTIRFKPSPVSGYFVVVFEPYPHFFPVLDQPEFNRYRLVIEEGNGPKEITVDNLSFIVKADALYGKVNRILPSSLFQFSDGQALKEVSLEPFWEGSYLKAPFGLVLDQGKAGTPRPITHYSIAGPVRSRCASFNIPEDWNIEASNNGTDWVLIDSRSGQKNWRDSETRTYAFKSSATYRYFRLKFDGLTPAFTRVYGWSLFSSDNNDPVENPVNPTGRPKTGACDSNYAFLKNVADYNIVVLGDSVYALPHSAGSIDLRRVDVGTVQGAFAAPTLKKAIEKIADALKARCPRVEGGANRLSPAALGPPPQFIKSIGKHNIIKFGEEFLAVPQSAGSVNLRCAREYERKDILHAETIDEIKDVLSSIGEAG